MGTYTTNYNLFLPTIGEQGWGDLVNGNFTTIDATMKGLDTRVGTLETDNGVIKDELNGIQNGEVSLPNLDVVTLNADNINGKLLVDVTTMMNSTHYLPVAKLLQTSVAAPASSADWSDYTIVPFYCSSLFNIANTSTEVTVTFGYGTGTNTVGNGGYAEVVTSYGETLLSLTNVRFEKYYNTSTTFTTTIAELMSGIQMRTKDTDSSWSMKGQISEIIFYV